MAVQHVERTTHPSAPLTYRRRVLVRLAGELGTKSPRTRRRFLNALVSNGAHALRAAGLHGSVRQEWSRIWADVPEGEAAAARQAMARLFGVRSAIEVLEVGFDSLDELVDRLAPLYAEQVRGHTFGVQARRAGTASVDPHDVAVALGAALLPVSAGVDLDHPQVPVPVLIGTGRAYACREETIGPGGLPLGSGGLTLALMSGGFDSPVATWQVMRRGVEVELVHFDLGGGGQVEAALTVARQLVTTWVPGRSVRIHVIDLAPLVQALQRDCDRRLRQVLLKRAMYRAASLLAHELGAEALVTGEALAQVSTQTLRSLAVCEAAADLPVLRPLIGMDKNDIIREARRIGTFEASERVQEHCSIAGVGPVITWPHRDAVESAESLVSEAATDAWTLERIAERQTFDLARWEPTAAAPSPEVDRVPEGALVVDVREPWEGDPFGDLQLPYSVALEQLHLLDADREYVLVCPAGTRSAALATRLRELGYRASSLRGGMERLPRS